MPAWVAASRSDLYWAPEAVLPRWLPAPTVVTVHDLGAIILPGSKSARQRSEFHGAAARSARYADRVIAVSESTAADVSSHWGIESQRIRVIGNGVDDSFRPGDRAAARAAIRRRFGLEGPIALAVGSLEARKGLDVLIEAAVRQRGDSPWHLVLAGAVGFGGEEIQRMAATSRNCTWLGPVAEDDLVDLYRAAEVLAVPSLHEGFGITALEAMACGTPVLVAEGSGGLEETSGPAAVVVRERTPEAWARAVNDARADRASLASAGIRHAAQFTWSAVARATREVFLSAVAEGGHHGGRRRSDGGLAMRRGRRST